MDFSTEFTPSEVEGPLCKDAALLMTPAFLNRKTGFLVIPDTSREAAQRVEMTRIPGRLALAEPHFLRAT